MIPAIESGFFQQEIADASYRFQREVDGKKRIIVGVNVASGPDIMEKCIILWLGGSL